MPQLYMWLIGDTVATSETPPAPGAKMMGIAPPPPPPGTWATEWIRQAQPASDQQRQVQQQAHDQYADLQDTLAERGIAPKPSRDPLPPVGRASVSPIIEGGPGSVVGHDGEGHPIVVQADGSRRIDPSKVLNNRGGYNAVPGVTAPATPAPAAPPPLMAGTPQSVLSRYAAPTGGATTGPQGTPGATPSAGAPAPPAGGAPAGGGATGPAAPASAGAVAPAGRDAPSRVSGVTIGDDEDYRAQMTQVLHSLGVVNADPYITDSLVDRFALAKANPNAIGQYFRSTPSNDVQGITLGQEIDYRKATGQALSALGVMRDPTSEEIARFARSGADPEAIHRAYSTSPEVLAANPGAQYDLSREDYLRQRGEIERSAASTFDLPASGTPTAGNEPGYLKEAFSERMAPAEVEAGFEDTQRRIGKAPTAEDVKGFRTRPKTPTEDDRAGPAGRITPTGPVQNIGRPDPNYVGPRRR